MFQNKFQNKIAVKLATVFIVFVMLCVSILGVLFIRTFSENHIAFRTESLRKAARQIARMQDVLLTNNKLPSESSLLETLDYTTDARIWIVDKNKNTVIRSTGSLNEHKQMGNCLLPNQDTVFMKRVLSGKETVSYHNKEFYDIDMMSVGVPIYQNGKVTGAVLLHTSLTALGEPIHQTALYLIWAILISIVIILIAVSIYAVSFTRPLKRMKEVAGKMTEGNYTVKTKIHQKDEIGDLAVSMDILAERLEEARRETNKLEQLRRDFVANVSHEFRTPLTVIKGNLETLIDTDVKEVKPYLCNILSETDALEKLVSDLLDLSRIESGKLEFHIETIDVKSVLSDVLRSIAPIATQKNISLDTSGISDEIPPLQSDYYRLRQILVIFLSNAVHYSTPEKTIRISTQISNCFKIKIEDQGYGIAKEDLPYVWDRFYKVDKMRSDKTSTGLGLAIARNLIVALGGEVTLTSEINIGSTVEITFPL